MTVREYAEKILLSENLADKLAPAPAGLVLDPPFRGGYRAPDHPGRPEALRPRSANETRTKMPSTEQLGDEDQRSVLLHFFCNHELLAVELMALALLKFPDAPDSFRRGLLHTLQEEQEHTRLYLDRMAATGTHFGDHSLSGMIWDHIATMTSPIEYVSRLSLTFEQSNLDYALHYSQAFAKVGDETTSGLLARIYKDEIAHVGYGLKWLRRFKQEQESDWDAWHQSLLRPLSPVRAKAPEGSVPFNVEGRQRAGLDQDFISRLQIYQRSRGRTPHLHHFNPNCESHLAASVTGHRYQANRAAVHLEEDLEALILANAHPDDIALLRIPPTSTHLASLKEAGLPLPEIVPLTADGTIAELASRKLGGFRPWAWSPEASALFKPLANNPTEKTLFPWQQAYPASFFEKALTARAAEHLQLSGNLSNPFTDPEEALAFIERELPNGPLLLKPPLACAGRGQMAISQETGADDITHWLKRTFHAQGAAVIEPLLSRVLDFSALYDLTRSGEVRFLSFTRLLTDARGHYRGTRVAPKIGNLFPRDLTVLFHQAIIAAHGTEHSGPDFYKKILPASLPTLLPGYQGPLAVDGFFYQDPEGKTRLRPVVEINPRCSMGRIAHNLRRKLSPNSVGELSIHRLKKRDPKEVPGLPLNDPTTAKSFLATWQSDL